jgi:hypothetical protein
MYILHHMYERIQSFLGKFTFSHGTSKVPICLLEMFLFNSETLTPDSVINAKLLVVTYFSEMGKILNDEVLKAQNCSFRISWVEWL